MDYSCRDFSRKKCLGGILKPSTQKKAQTALLISTPQFLAHQGLAMRGHNDSEGNYIQLLQQCSQDCPTLVQWLQRRTTWTSHDIQNELLKIMTRAVLRQILNCAKACTVGTELHSAVLNASCFLHLS